jgi:hypothetical protein
MPANSASNGSMRIVKYLCIVTILLFGYAQAQSQAPTKDAKNPKTWPYNERSFARVFGNVGGWWSFLNENDKAAFLDGYQAAMKESLSRIENLCKVIKESPFSNQEDFFRNAFAATIVCNKASEFEGFEKITIKDLDDFYSDPVNQFILLEWSMGYLRDKASGRKTEGQLLDALKAEQKDVHDCSKYPHTCKAGTTESQHPQ